MQTDMIKFSTDLNTTSVAPRNSQSAMMLQRNLRFEACLLNDHLKASHVFVSPKIKTASMQYLLPLSFVIKHMVIINAMREKKFLVFKLMDAVEGLEESLRILFVEEAGMKVLEHVFVQDMTSLVDVNAKRIYALSDLDSYVLKRDPMFSSILLKAFFVGLQQNVQELGSLLFKLKQVVRLKNFGFTKTNVLSKWTFIKTLRWKYVKSANISVTKSKRLLRFFAIRLLKSRNKRLSVPLLKQFVWKRNSFALMHFSFNMRGKRPRYISLRDDATSFLYLLKRLENKRKALEQTDSEGVQQLVLARNYLLKLAEERLHSVRQKSLLLGRPNAVRGIRRTFWRNLSAKLLVKMNARDLAGQQVTRGILNVIMPILLGKSPKATVSELTLNTWKRSNPAQDMRFPLVNKKIVENDSVYSTQGYSNALSAIMGKNVDVFFINALALTRFGFQSENKGKSSYRFLQNIDREMVSRYKYVAVYIQDFVRVGFIALFLKKPTFLAQFMAFQIEKLPRNRKETKMVRFLIKVVKVFAAQRREVVGLRMLFKGRVNRWRRTKQIVGEKGVLPFQSVSARIEFGSAKAITRKGALGIRLWICYMPIFTRELRNVFLDYVEYSQQLRVARLNRFLSKI